MINSPERHSVAALVAAAGLSRRMGAPKQLLPWGERTVIAAVVEHLTQAGAAPIVVVTGHRHDEIQQALAGSAAHVCFNPDYAQREMLSSYQVGLRALAASSCVGTLLALGDQPHIPIVILQQIIEQASVAPDNIVIPSYNMRRGHPFYLPRALWAELLALSENETLRTLLQRHQALIRYAEVASDAILRDMDTPGDYESLRENG